MAGISAIVIGAVVFVVAGVIGTRYLRRVVPATPGRRGETELTVPSGGVETRALVCRLEQDGMSRGHSSHRCRLDLLVEVPDAGTVRSVSCVADLATTSLPWFAPGCVVEVVPDPRDAAVVVPSIDATRRGATGIDPLPALRCGGVPDQVYLDDEERQIAGGVAKEAIVSCIDIDTSEYATRDRATIGLWVLDDDAAPGGSSPRSKGDAPATVNGAGHAAVVSERLLLVQILEVPLGATVPVTADPNEATRVAIDYRQARQRLLDRHAPSRPAMVAAATVMGLDPDETVTSITSLTMTGSSHGIRQGCRLTLEPRPDRDGSVSAAAMERTAVAVELSVTVPDLVQLIPGSVVIVAPDPSYPGRVTIDLALTAAVRARAGAAATDWVGDLPPSWGAG